MATPSDEFHEADGTPKRLEPKRYAGPGDDERPLPAGKSHVWTEGNEPGDADRR